MLSIILPALSSAEHAPFFSFSNDYLHEDLHLNGCRKFINNTYTNKAKAARYLLLPDMNLKKKSINVSYSDFQVSAFRWKLLYGLYLTQTVHRALCMCQWPDQKKEWCPKSKGHGWHLFSVHMDWILRISRLETRICPEIIPSLDLHLFCNKTSLNDLRI